MPDSTRWRYRWHPALITLEAIWEQLDTAHAMGWNDGSYWEQARHEARIAGLPFSQDNFRPPQDDELWWVQWHLEHRELVHVP